MKSWQSTCFRVQDPIGRQIGLMALGTVQIVGVVGHVKQWGLDSDDTAKIRDQIYFPFRKCPISSCPPPWRG